MIVLRESAYVCVPWKNGGGQTREIHREPPGPAAFDWRLSLAAVDRGGPFSAFEGYDRTLVLVRGAGIELSFGPHGQAKLSAVGQVVSFDGGWPTSCTLLDGPSTDLNLIVSQERSQFTSRCLSVPGRQLIPTAGWSETLVCCVSGSVQITNTAGAMEELAAVDIARCFPLDGLATCRALGSGAAQIFIAAIRAR